MGSNAAFLLFILGILAIYWEFLRPGLLLPALLGLAMTITGSYWLWSHSPQPAGILLIVFAASLFVVEAFWDAYSLPAVLGTISLLAGFSPLFQPGGSISPLLFVPGSLVLGGISIFLAGQAKRARRNKRSGL